MQSSRPRTSLLAYETRSEPPVHTRAFLRRVALHFGVAAGLLGISLALGMLGYVSLEQLSWMDAFLNSAMLLGGMGPVNAPLSDAGKLFAGIYALYAGLAFIVTAALLVTPIAHRVLHRFHWDDEL